tara:strand:+ start:3095 stop:3619 length:525 start_codon:yes stop_codon:yes gene_type:complete
MESLESNKLRRVKRLIYVLSAAIPLAVAALFGVKVEGVNLSFLPPFYASLNALTAVVLVSALIAIKKKNKTLHQRLMQFAIVLSLLFLLAYVAYHMTSDSTSYDGEAKLAYYFILISHIILSIVVIPIVLFTYLFAWQGDFVRHKKWTRFAWPIWMYVAVTGVIVYWMISPYYS